MIKAVLHAAEVKARLLAMSESARRNVYKRALRKAAKPVVQELRNAWRGARRRKGAVTGEIAVAQAATIDMKRSGVAILKVGTNYKRGGGAKLWHILENGFVHYGRNATYRPADPDVRAAKAERAKFFQDALGDPAEVKKLAKTKDGRAVIKAKYKGIKAAWTMRDPAKEQLLNAAWRSRKDRRDSARATGGNRTVLGRRVSRPIAQKYVTLLTQRAKDELAREVMRAGSRATGRKAA